MRVKKHYVILTFRTTTEALSMESRCLEKRIPGRLIPVPGQIRAGCGLAWRILSSEYERYQYDIKELEICFEDIVECMI